jgi:hypothetical protein
MNANEIAPDRGRPAPLWLKARERTIGFRPADLKRTHWKKVWRSMFKDDSKGNTSSSVTSHPDS